SGSFSILHPAQEQDVIVFFVAIPKIVLIENGRYDLPAMKWRSSLEYLIRPAVAGEDYVRSFGAASEAIRLDKDQVVGKPSFHFGQLRIEGKQEVSGVFASRHLFNDATPINPSQILYFA